MSGKKKVKEDYDEKIVSGWKMFLCPSGKAPPVKSAALAAGPFPGERVQFTTGFRAAQP